MTKENEPSVYFNKLNDQEKTSKLNMLANLPKAELIVWEKGSAMKHKLKVGGPLSKKLELIIIDHFPKSLFSKNLLINFNLSGLKFFGTGIIDERENSSIIKLIGELYKSERRSNFRLLTHPHHEVYIYIKAQNENDSSQSNILHLHTKTTETGLFKNFLTLIDGGESVEKNDEYLKFKVLDLSVTGLALQVGELEKKYLPEMNVDFGMSYLEFNDQKFQLPGAEILYINLIKSDKGVSSVYKAGIKFLNVDTNLDEQLSSLLNKTLRGVEKEFEDFLK